MNNELVHVESSKIRTYLISSIMDLWRSNVASEVQLAVLSSLKPGISDSFSMLWASSASLLMSDVSPLGSDVNS